MLTAAEMERLYHLLARDEPDAAHSRYNAYIRRLVSFERIAECVGSLRSAGPSKGW